MSCLRDGCTAPGIEHSGTCASREAEARGGGQAEGADWPRCMSRDMMSRDHDEGACDLGVDGEALERLLHALALLAPGDLWEGKEERWSERSGRGEKSVRRWCVCVLAASVHAQQASYVWQSTLNPHPDP
eukprot:2904922-Rhodomonas_salina.2